MRPRLLLALALAAPLSAQSPGERAMLSGWDDSLQRVASASAIQAYDGPSRRGSGRAGDIRRGLFLVREADLKESRGDIELTLTNMQLIASRSNWAWPHYVMARAFEVMTRREWMETLSDGKELAEKHSDALWRTLRTALDRDPSLRNARHFLAELTAAGGDRFLRPDQLVALQRESHQPDAEANALLAWARHLRTLQDYHRALEMFDRTLQSGGDPSILALERARTSFALGDSAAAIESYWSGAEHLTQLGRQTYRADLWWIAEPEELTAFDEMPDNGVALWLRRFWGARDAEAANFRGERLAEHLRRWVVAYARYRALSPWTDAFWSRLENMFGRPSCENIDAKLFEQLWRFPPAFDGDLRVHEPILDHRGILYLRHGEPTRIITDGGIGGATLHRRTLSDPYTAGTQAIGPTGVRLPWSSRMVGEIPAVSIGPSGESWMYWWDGDLHVVHFRGSDALGHYAPTTLTEATPPYLMNNTAVASSLPIKEYYAMAQRIAANDSSAFGPNGPKYAPKDNPGCFNEVRAVAARAEHDEASSIHRDSDTPPSFRGYNSVSQVFALGVAIDQSSGVLATFAIPGSALTPDTLENGQFSYTIAWRIVAYDRVANQTYSVDTMRYFVTPRVVGPREFLTGYTEFGLRAGNWQIASRASQVNGASVLQDVRQVRIDRGGEVALSDVVTGRPGHPAWAATDNGPFPLNYPNGWYPGENAELFFEVRGVPERETYRTTVEVRPADGKSDAAIRVQSDDRGVGEVTRVRKTLALDQLAAGRYTLTVTVEFQGHKAARQREILIVPR